MHHVQGQSHNQFQLVCLEQMVASYSFVRMIDVYVGAIYHNTAIYCLSK